MNDAASLQSVPGYVNSTYLEVTAAYVEGMKRRTYELMQLESGLRVLDLGCGPATDTIAFAERVGPTGRVIGVDHDAEMVTLANERATEAGVDRWTEHVQADARALPFEDGSFDRVHAERVLQHLQRPEEALAELVRVTAPGGLVCIGEPDWGTFSMDCELVDVERRLARFNADQFARSGYVGRSLVRLLTGAGLGDIALEPFPTPFNSYPFTRYTIDADRLEEEAIAAGVVSAEEITHLREDCERADAAGTFFALLVGVWVSGRKLHIERE